MLGKIVDEKVIYIEGCYYADREVWTSNKAPLDLGVYIVYVHYDFMPKTSAIEGDKPIDYNLAIYGPKEVFIREKSHAKCENFLKEAFKDKARKSKDHWLSHSKYGEKESFYYIETTDVGFSYFYYNNRSRALLTEDIEFKKLENVVIEKPYTPSQMKIHFKLKPNAEKIILLRNLSQNNTFRF